MPRHPRLKLALTLGLTTRITFALAGSITAASAEDSEGIAFFEKSVRPLLAANCYECHSEESGKRKGGLWLDRREGWQTGGDLGPVVIPGELDGSLLLHAIRYRDEDLQMPPKSRLSDADVAVFERWISMGAPDPRDAAIAGSVRREAIDYEKARQGWAFRPAARPSAPSLRDPTWAESDIDRFILAGLEEKNLAPVEDASPTALIRRVFYDLTGLPPTHEEIDAFARNPTKAAFTAIVDDLLSRPGFGETWGRHWLDVARYADSNGGDRNFTYYQAWRYRDYVIDAYNRDKPYYDFVSEQLAGDLLPAKSPQQRADQLTASTFLALGPKMLTERDKEKLWMDTVDEQIDTLGRAFLGLTLGCARCHDHKFDPVSQEDYYAVAGIFRSTEVVTGTRNGCVNVASWVEQPLPIGGTKEEALKAKVDRLELAMRLTVEKAYKKKVGGKMTLDMLPLAGTIYDDSDAELIGHWVESTFSSNRFGPHYIHDDAKHKGENRAIFRASVPQSGTYEVRLAYNASDNRARNLPITVEARDAIHELTFDQTVAPDIGGLFRTIGRFEFEKGGRANVIIGTGGSTGYAIVDAVQFVAVADIDRETEALAAAEEKGGAIDPLFRMNEGELKKELDRLIGELKDEPLVMAPRDVAEPDDTHFRVRGDVGQLGEKVPRNFLRLLYDGPTPEIPRGASGRKQFAEWITSEENALLDRVYVNRVWYHLFDRGIVASVDNFGRLGTEPTHPELLDHLAAIFRENGGSTKLLIREIVLSHAYRISSTATPSLAEADPENRLFGHQNRRRLTAEEIRDSYLFLAGKLDRNPAGPTATPYGVDLDDPVSFADKQMRTVYLPVARNNLAAELEVFDAANPDLVTGRRARTTVPTQALYLLNSDFVENQAMRIGAEASESAPQAGAEIDLLYQTLLGRGPNPVERQRALGFMANLTGGSEDRHDLEIACGHLAHVIMASAEFLYLD
ncbi:MAG: DUF1549 domain-containing protein [Verrucomicrobiae bacterium]|nr:DUF1549 domain-containing protein [Verrucomicrobiae bacterium]